MVQVQCPKSLRALTLFEDEAALKERLAKMGLSVFTELIRNTTPELRVEIVRFLAAPKFARSGLMLSATVQELETKFTQVPEPGNAFHFVVARFSDAGEGIAVLPRTSEEFKSEKIMAVLASVLMIPELDRVIRLTDKPALTNALDQILKFAQTGNTKAWFC